MPLHPQAEAMRARRAAAGTPPLYTRSLAEARAADLADLRAATGTGEGVHHVGEFTVDGPGGPLALRHYRPAPRPADAAPGPALLYLYGGGWALGSLDTGDPVCRALANATGADVLAVGYRHAPEHRFPAAVHDCWAALDWIARHAPELGLDPARIAVGGDSAGGNLAAALTLLARERGGPAILHQLLVYPNTDHRVPPPGTDDDPALFNRHSVAWYWDHYLADPADGANPLASPLRAPSLAGLPPATVLTAEYDPLREEGEQYAEALRAAGVPVELRRYDGMPHGFFAMPGVLDDGRAAQLFAAERLLAAYRAAEQQR
ncbi:alpha/beta hydrolase [Kitasatospora sp. YST-16]|uniref:alpha/beta hydrolase n=1 Tax=Kitasatospora sp. YST-16 TaxID=2998080 RepID=UPI0022836EDE|nr:alpha/beta hydrolase [Kitasatospora sp. YST-16]WAL75396.1 alpha/beta hydrolase [Kitasatospora sp. YST-16]WNW41456.1 alpha/beta hydrolase [Streptomyces sp. Li-HN-5-13]